MKDNEMRLAAKEFEAYRKDKGYEKGENQMMNETENIIHMNLDFLLLKFCANIVVDNALRINRILCRQMIR